jgi:hypothetical protein
MSARHFESVQERAEGRQIRTFRLTCGHCGRTENIGNQNASENTAQDFVAKKFQIKGWIVGRRLQDDRCPGCSSAIKASVARKKLAIVHNAETKTVQQTVATVATVATGLKANPPRDMSFDERRLIIGKLHDVYLDERRGYDTEWSDKRVATDLGVPIAWVDKLRSENFGPKNSNSEAEEVLASARAVIERINTDVAAIKAELARVTDLVEQFDTKMRDVVDRAERAIKRIEAQF